MERTEIFKQLKLLKEKSVRNFSIWKSFMTASNQEIGSRFHSFAAKTSIDKFKKPLSYLYLLFVLISTKN